LLTTHRLIPEVWGVVLGWILIRRNTTQIIEMSLFMIRKRLVSPVLKMEILLIGLIVISRNSISIISIGFQMEMLETSPEGEVPLWIGVLGASPEGEVPFRLEMVEASPEGEVLLRWE
jgi:hypothetical protein